MDDPLRSCASPRTRSPSATVVRNPRWVEYPPPSAAIISPPLAALWRVVWRNGVDAPEPRYRKVTPTPEGPGGRAKRRFGHLARGVSTDRPPCGSVHPG